MLVVRNSDRAAFKSCRQRWDFASTLRQRYEPLSRPKPLDFGSAIHVALETYYDPETWGLDREVVEANSIMRFVETNNGHLKEYEAAIDQPVDDLVREDFTEREALGVGMLRSYFQYARANDAFRPLRVEVNFEVPLAIPAPLIDPPLEDVCFQGRIDLICIDDIGQLWIVDHKTAAQLRSDVLTFLEMDEQMKAYAWALHQVGLPVVGCVYNELYKGVPAPPPMNKVQRLGRWYSVNMNVDSTAELYEETVKLNDPYAYSEGLYDDIIQHLRLQGNKFMRRTVVRYNQDELDNMGRQLCMEAVDMFNAPLIYPNATRFHCNNCAFRTPCLQKMDGSDYQFTLDTMYRKRETADGTPPDTSPQAVEERQQYQDERYVF